MARTGRPCSEKTLYARELGISPRALARLGGMYKLKSMSADAQAILVSKVKIPWSANVRRGGMSARNMISRVPAMLTQNRGKPCQKKSRP